MPGSSPSQGPPPSGLRQFPKELVDIPAFAEAARWCQEHGGHAVMFDLRGEYGLTVVAIHDCLDVRTLEPDADAREVIDRLSSYTEVDDAGRGVTIIVKGTRRGWKTAAGRFEVHTHYPMVWLTGRRMPGTPGNVESRQDALDWLSGKLFPAPPPTEPARPKQLSPEAQVVVQRLRRAKGRPGMQARRFLKGDVEEAMALGDREASGAGAGDVRDRADFVFGRLVYYLADGDLRLVKEVFMWSPMYRPERGEEYLQRLLNSISSAGGPVRNENWKKAKAREAEKEFGWLARLTSTSISADGLAKVLDIDPSNARKKLRAAVKAGFMKTTKGTPTKGRPGMVYEWTPWGVEFRAALIATENERRPLLPP